MVIADMVDVVDKTYPGFLQELLVCIQYYINIFLKNAEIYSDQEDLEVISSFILTLADNIEILAKLFTPISRQIISEIAQFFNIKINISHVEIEYSYRDGSIYHTYDIQELFCPTKEAWDEFRREFAYNQTVEQLQNNEIGVLLLTLFSMQDTIGINFSTFAKRLVGFISLGQSLNPPVEVL